MASFPHCNSDSISFPTSAQSVSVSEADGKLSSWQFLFDTFPGTLADGESRHSMLDFYLLEDRLASKTQGRRSPRTGHLLSHCEKGA